MKKLETLQVYESHNYFENRNASKHFELMNLMIKLKIKTYQKIENK